MGVFLTINARTEKLHYTNSVKQECVTYILCSVEPTPGLGVNFAGRAGDCDRLDIARLGIFLHGTGRVLGWGW